ncbi:flagellar protein MotY [Marinimicrobium locisalis]|uniref:flagellar protein MotY n=1 Tax=Marinimicrobium locisalis TaxID=546022 RepID=UPI0032222208
MRALGQSLRRAKWLVLCSLMVAATGARAEVFGGPVADARWELDASIFECRLSHSIPRFGEAVFARRAGESQRFVLRQNNRFLATGEARVRVEHPVWRETASAEPLGPVEVQLGAQAVTTDWRYSQRLAAELREGRRLVFTREPWHSRETPVEVIVAPVGFRAGIDAFHACLQDLLPVNFDQVERTSLSFPKGARELPEEEVEKLEPVLLYAQADRRVDRVYVDGHTDGVGLRAENLELSRERAEMVTEYLVDRGIPERQITTRWHGERYPVATNQTAEGREENRRVTIRLERSGQSTTTARAP